MAKKKLIRFGEMENFPNVLQASLDEVLNKDHHFKGKWKSEVFKNENPIILELACGKGEYTVGMAAIFPEKNFIGIDIKGARIWYGAKEALDSNLDNVRFVRTRIDFINSFFAKNEIDEIWITFPDPQPQKNRARKRLTNKIFIERYRQILPEKGIVNLKTDSDFFFDFTKEQVSEHKYKVLRLIEDVYNDSQIESEEEKKVLRIKTHYEQLFAAKGHRIKYIRFMV